MRSASVVVRESQSAVEKERGALSTARRSKRENANARVRMLRCSSLVACVLTTDINNALMLSSRCSEARAPRRCRCRRSAAARAVRTCLSSTRARGHARARGERERLRASRRAACHSATCRSRRSRSPNLARSRASRRPAVAPRMATTRLTPLPPTMTTTTHMSTKRSTSPRRRHTRP